MFQTWTAVPKAPEPRHLHPLEAFGLDVASYDSTVQDTASFRALGAMPRSIHQLSSCLGAMIFARNRSKADAGAQILLHVGPVGPLHKALGSLKSINCYCNSHTHGLTGLTHLAHHVAGL